MPVGGLALDPGLDELLGPRRLIDVAQFRGEVGAFAEQGVAADAVARLPDFFAGDDLGRQILAVVPLGQFLVVSKVRARKSRKKNTVPP
jgi:hypothetical protein